MTDYNSTCERCGAQFGCDITAGKTSCWCFEMPKLPSSGQGQSCLCPDCLRKAIEQYQDQKS